MPSIFPNADVSGGKPFFSVIDEDAVHNVPSMARAPNRLGKRSSHPIDVANGLHKSYIANDNLSEVQPVGSFGEKEDRLAGTNLMAKWEAGRLRTWRSSSWSRGKRK